MISIIAILFISYILLFLYSLKIRDNSIVDVFWGFGFIIIALISFFQSSKDTIQYVLTFLIILWGVRLTTHIGLRKLREHREDPRYAKWREEWGTWWYFIVRSFFQVYLLQMILMMVIALPILVINLEYIHTPDWLLDGGEIGTKVRWIITAGVMIALFGLIFETVADRQLEKFIKVKKPGQIFTDGLYRYSRHPNYFGESMFWLGISLISLPYSYIGIIGWMTITCLLLFVSGVPLQEARYEGRANWEDYKKKTNVFVPWFPEK